MRAVERLTSEDRDGIVAFLVRRRGMSVKAAKDGLAGARFSEIDRLLVEMKLDSDMAATASDYNPYARGQR